MRSAHIVSLSTCVGLVSQAERVYREVTILLPNWSKRDKNALLVGMSKIALTLPRRKFAGQLACPRVPSSLEDIVNDRGRGNAAIKIAPPLLLPAHRLSWATGPIPPELVSG